MLHRLEGIFYSEALADPVLKSLFTERRPLNHTKMRICRIRRKRRDLADSAASQNPLHRIAHTCHVSGPVRVGLPPLREMARVARTQ
jgi:hypothetical protein